MKNRLEVAKSLLSSEGVIIVQISFHEFPYLRILMDEIFSEQNHKMDVNVLVRHPERSLTADKEFNDVVEYALVYSDNLNYKLPKKKIAKTIDDYQYDFNFSDTPYETIDIEGKKVNIYLPEMVNISKTEGHEGGRKSISVRGTIREKNSSGRFYVAHLEKLIGVYPEGTIFTVPDMGDDGLGFRVFELPKNNNKNGFYYQGKPLNSDYTLIPYPNYLDCVAQYNMVNDEGEVSFRNGKKPESYIQHYLNIFTEENDIVLDYHLGSGTTAAVAHKMNRRYIGIEQMDYIETISIERLKNVISGEQGGISKDVEWQGGGSFVYCELKNDAQDFLNKVYNSSTSEELLNLLEQVKKSSFLSYRVEAKKLKKEDFTQLSLGEQKYLLEELINKNNLFVNYSDIDDVDNNVSVKEKELNRQFYEGV